LALGGSFQGFMPASSSRPWAGRCSHCTRHAPVRSCTPRRGRASCRVG